MPVINVDGIEPGKLKLDGPTMAKIFMGEIKTWNDPAIAALNPGMKLPEGASPWCVVPTARAPPTTSPLPGQGQPEWKEKYNFGTTVNWPVGVGGKGNEGIAAYVKQIKGSIGYVEYAYALTNKMTHVQLKERRRQLRAARSQELPGRSRSADWKSARTSTC